MTEHNKDVARDATKTRPTPATWTPETEIASLTAQALNGNTIHNRHLALVQLLTKLESAPRSYDDLIIVARDAAIKHSIGLTDTIAALLTNQPLPAVATNERNDPDVIPLYVQHREDKNDPPDVSIDTIAEHMAHDPAWEKALLSRRAQIGKLDLFDLKERACRIVDDSDTYSKAVRDRVDHALNKGNDLAALLAAVTEAEDSATPEANTGGHGSVFNVYRDEAHASARAIIDNTGGEYTHEQRSQVAVLLSRTIAAEREDINSDEARSLARELTDLVDQIEQGEDPKVTELRERITQLESEVDKWKSQPWVLEHEGRQYSATGRRRGESEIPELLDDLAIKVAVEHIGENTTGAVFTGAILLLIEHVGRLAFDKRFNDLDMAIDDIRKGLLEGSYMEKHTVESLRIATDDSIHEWVEYKVTGDMRELSEDFERYNDKRQRRRYDSK